MDAKSFTFTSQEGINMCREVLRVLMPHDTHDWQLEAIAHLLDGDDVLLIIATGSGKTDVFIRLMHVQKYLAANPNCVTGHHFPQDPVMIVICSTKALEDEMEKRMQATNLTATAINNDRVNAARQEGRDLFREVCNGVSVVLVSPEQLKSPKFRNILDDAQFNQRISMMAIDEVHLMNTWGQTFRRDYEQTGWMRARIGRRVTVLAVTATLQAGIPTRRVCEFLGFQDGQYHVIRRSNMRHDIQLLFRTMQSGIRGTKFPELDWILKERHHRVLLLCATINLDFRADAYLWHNEHGDLASRMKRIHMFNALNWKSYNDEILALWKEDDPDIQVIIATSILSVGIDAPRFDDVDEYWQEIGRIRPRGKQNDSRGILYMTQGAEDTARAVLAGPGMNAKQKGKKSNTQSMTTSMARLILARCKIIELDKLYDNPVNDSPCTCSFCLLHPPLVHRAKCICSG
ncbi:P-loop containing nucleoside triphosphate hydrolase protein, partial [Phlebopus sp. FC_14]